MTNVRTPPLSDVETAIKIYYSKIELHNEDVKELFPTVKSKATITRLKKKAREIMAENNILSYNAQAVNTQAAFMAWGLDIKDLETRYNKLKKFELIKN